MIANGARILSILRRLDTLNFGNRSNLSFKPIFTARIYIVPQAKITFYSDLVQFLWVKLCQTCRVVQIKQNDLFHAAPRCVRDKIEIHNLAGSVSLRHSEHDMTSAA